MQHDKFQKKVEFFTLVPLPKDNEISRNTSNAGEGISMKIKEGCHQSYFSFTKWPSRLKHLQGFNKIPSLVWEKKQKSKLADIC